QVIGYVGSTGLATGPHVCYRFWENGRQVDALKQNFRASTPIAKEYRVAFEKSIKEQKNDLANIATKKKQINYTAYQQGPPSLFVYFGTSNSISPEEQSF